MKLLALLLSVNINFSCGAPSNSNHVLQKVNRHENYENELKNALAKKARIQQEEDYATYEYNYDEDYGNGIADEQDLKKTGEEAIKIVETGFDTIVNKLKTQFGLGKKQKIAKLLKALIQQDEEDYDEAYGEDYDTNYGDEFAREQDLKKSGEDAIKVVKAEKDKIVKKLKNKFGLRRNLQIANLVEALMQDDGEEYDVAYGEQYYEDYSYGSDETAEEQKKKKKKGFLHKVGKGAKKFAKSGVGSKLIEVGKGYLNDQIPSSSGGSTNRPHKG